MDTNYTDAQEAFFAEFKANIAKAKVLQEKENERLALIETYNKWKKNPGTPLITEWPGRPANWR